MTNFEQAFRDAPEFDSRGKDAPPNARDVLARMGVHIDPSIADGSAYFEHVLAHLDKQFADMIANLNEAEATEPASIQNAQMELDVDELDHNHQSQA